MDGSQIGEPTRQTSLQANRSQRSFRLAAFVDHRSHDTGKSETKQTNDEAKSQGPPLSTKILWLGNEICAQRFPSVRREVNAAARCQPHLGWSVVIRWSDVRTSLVSNWHVSASSSEKSSFVGLQNNRIGAYPLLDPSIPNPLHFHTKLKIFARSISRRPSGAAATFRRSTISRGGRSHRLSGESRACRAMAPSRLYGVASPVLNVARTPR